jgi:hypothetical protein
MPFLMLKSYSNRFSYFLQCVSDRRYKEVVSVRVISIFYTLSNITLSTLTIKTIQEKVLKIRHTKLFSDQNDHAAFL